MNSKSGENFSVANVGSFSELDEFTFEAANLPLKVQGKVFLKELLSLTSAEISFNSIPPGKSIPFYHKHRFNEEIYIFIRGAGEFQVDNVVFPVTEGTVVRVDCEGERCWRNTSDADLHCITIQARAGSFPNHTIQDGLKVERAVSWEEKTRV
jgi:mannose-6-phosphate isomerase-like protein (cupin superfamily)